MRRWTWSSLVQVMAFISILFYSICYYLNQCWLIVKWTLRNKFQWNLSRNSGKFIWIYRLRKWWLFCAGGDELRCYIKISKWYQHLYTQVCPTILFYPCLHGNDSWWIPGNESPIVVPAAIFHIHSWIVWRLIKSLWRLLNIFFMSLQRFRGTVLPFCINVCVSQILLQ